MSSAALKDFLKQRPNKWATYRSVLRRLNSKANPQPSPTLQTTVDEKEVKHFTEQVWWEKNSELKVLQAMNKIRVPFVRDCLINSRVINEEVIDSPTPLQGIKIIDVGCGGGFFSEPLARLGATVTGIDATPNAITTAQNHASLDPSIERNLTYLETTIEEHAAKNKAVYDVVVSSEVIEHVTNKELFVKACTETLTPGGSIVMTTISQTIMSLVGAIWAAEYVFKLLPVGTHQHEKFITPYKLRRMLEQNSCTTRVVHGMLYNPITNKWHWIGNTAINYAIHAIKKK